MQRDEIVQARRLTRDLRGFFAETVRDGGDPRTQVVPPGALDVFRGITRHAEAARRVQLHFDLGIGFFVLFSCKSFYERTC